MARPREFETEAALDGAMAVFWAMGYDGASLPLLLDGMGLTRGSFYKAFGDKKSLFLMILRRYEDHAVTPAVELLSDRAIPNGAERIRQLFASVLEDVRAGDDRGCLFCSAAAGPAAEDEDIAQVTLGLLKRMEGAFETAIDQSDLSSSENGSRADLAHLLVTQYVGLRILARSKAPLAFLQQSVQAIRDQVLS